MTRILLLAGDGIGPEIMTGAKMVLDYLREDGLDIEYEEMLIGGAAIDALGQPFPEKTQKAVEHSDAVLLGAVGGPQWNHLPVEQRPESGLLALRQFMGVFANLRPIKVHPALADQSPLKLDKLQGVDILIVRELIGGIYFGEPRGHNPVSDPEAFNTMRYSESEILRIAHKAFALARQRRSKLTSIDKANVLEVSRLWRTVVDRCAQEYPDVKVEHLYVDNAAMQFILNPSQFDVVLTSNLFGDILSDLGAAVVGSIGLLPSASVHGQAGGLFEPVHGSAPDIAGSDQANPLATLASLAMLLRHTNTSEVWAKRIEVAIDQVIEEGLRTPDIAREDEKSIPCSQMIQTVCGKLSGFKSQAD